MGLCFRHQVLKPKPNELNSSLSQNEGSMFFPKRHKQKFRFMKPNFNILHSDAKALKLLINNRVYLGHKTKKWNPQMKPFLRKNYLTLFVGKKRQAYAHILDPLKTLSHLNYLSVCLSKAVFTRKKILFVGTKSQYKGLISKAAHLCNSYFITEKWLGGLLTNWQTVSTLTILLRKYDILIAQGVLAGMYKKEAARAYKEKNRLQRLLEGVKYMSQKPDLVVVMGQLSETTVLDECKKIHIPSICLVDSNCSPRISNLVLPTNDDSTRSLNPLFEIVINSIKRGRLLFLDKNKPKEYKLIYPSKLHIPLTPGPWAKKKKKYQSKPRPKFNQKLSLNSSTQIQSRTKDQNESKFNEENNTMLKFSKNRTINSIETVQKGSSVLPNGLPEFSTNLTALPNDFSVLPKKLPKKKLQIQGLGNGESQVKQKASGSESNKTQKLKIDKDNGNQINNHTLTNDEFEIT